DFPFVEYAWESGLDNTTINSLFWIGANYYRPVDLPDTTGLSWREGILHQPTPRLAEPEPEPTEDREPEPRATEPSPMG
ncbi:hypothetical protein M9458_039603, partial [Cirrhinus mrigala]